ncbi:MAG: ABC transporter permease [Saprospiraceae bacterium]|nr:ABC transporter permease [Candidatus Vicinibacter affinis]
MEYLLKLEWLKNRKNTVFILICISYVVMLPGTMMIGKSVNPMPPVLPGNFIFFEFPTNWDFFAYAGSWLAFFMFGFFAVYTVTAEYSFKTLRQSIINGLQRNQFVSAKLLFILMMCVGATLYYVLCVLACGYIHEPHTKLDFAFDQPLIILKFFLMNISYGVFGLLLGFLLRRSGLALFTYMIYIMMLEPFIRWVLVQKYIHKSAHIYFPMNVFEDLTPLPFYRMMPEQFKTAGGAMALVPDHISIPLSIGYIFVFIWGMYYLINKRDL